MKNILVTACYEVDHMYGLGEVKYEDYQNINKKCVESFENNLKDLDQSIILDGHVDTYHKLFQEIYWRIKDIYRNNQPCNLLWSDSDNICLRPVEIFNKFDKFAMFYDEKKSIREIVLTYINLFLAVFKNWRETKIKHLLLFSKIAIAIAIISLHKILHESRC